MQLGLESNFRWTITSGVTELVQGAFNTSSNSTKLLAQDSAYEINRQHFGIMEALNWPDDLAQSLFMPEYFQAPRDCSLKFVGPTILGFRLLLP